MPESISKKKWPMPDSVHHKTFKETQGETTQKLDDTRAKIESDQSHNAKIIKKQTPKKWG